MAECRKCVKGGASGGGDGRGVSARGRRGDGQMRAVAVGDERKRIRERSWRRRDPGEGQRPPGLSADGGGETPGKGSVHTG